MKATGAKRGRPLISKLGRLKPVTAAFTPEVYQWLVKRGGGYPSRAMKKLVLDQYEQKANIQGI